jgi:hypothetical protein
MKSLRRSRAEVILASQEIARSRPTIFEKLSSDPPSWGRRSRNATTAKAHSPNVRSPITITTKARPIAAAIPRRGSRPASTPRPTAARPSRRW